MDSSIQIRISPEVELEIIRFLHKEANLLDHRKYKEWLELLADEIEYRMPLRETVEGVGVNDIASDSSFFEETKLSLTTRVNRLYTKSAWVENPATRQRHFISNIMVEPTEDPNEFKVTSYFLYKRSRGSTHVIEELFGERNDIIRKVHNEYKIVSRTIIPDQAVITTMNMSMFL
ncbi:3-phenylpropionate/cinnamic acid dioxygenase subunit beta [Neobacillus cucumis]|uniref:3-phenylpropionate/cinnamic acid dioxygenase subunit beta n=1 Tax=Neobacillus cucumis TaxID=1740721 RepID=UPI0019669AAF|nr:3-phenylpropionate/cinnamic acid dioxygenase subunit beta [Neobacillus cucumis]MBM7656298.1 3-phenylpropionate/cinnamic acid dioxygenase small subunit [Neobacillus cucumis]